MQGMKVIRRKIMVSFTLLVTCIVVALVGVISLQSGRSITQQSHSLEKELTEQFYGILDGHNAVATALLADTGKELAIHAEEMALNPAIIVNIEKNQLPALAAVLKKSTQNQEFDYASIFDAKGGFMIAYPPAGHEAEIVKLAANDPIHQKALNLAKSREKTVPAGFVLHPRTLYETYALSGEKRPGSKVISLETAHLVSNDFGEPLGVIIVGKVLNGANPSFTQLFETTGASIALFQDTEAISFSGFPATLEAPASMNLSPDLLASFTPTTKTRLNLPLAGESYLASCSILKTGDTTTSSVLCAAQPEFKISSIRHKIESVSIRSKLSLQMWISFIGATAFALFIIASVFITRSIVTPLQKIMHLLGDSSAELHSASAQMASASQELSDGASRQTASLEETSASLTDISSLIGTTASHSSQANRLMDEVSQTIESTTASMQGLHDSMLALSRSSEETSKIIKSIDAIAFQTNLLALNASVEAARAGEAGAGFAVVADEVRNLARRAAEAAKNTAELLEQSLTNVHSGTSLVDATRNGFQKTTDSVSKVAALIGEISESSSRQASAIQTISSEVNGINGITMANMAHSEEAAAISQNFATQADRLHSIVEELSSMIHDQGSQQANQPESSPKKPSTRGKRRSRPQLPLTLPPSPTRRG